MCTVNKEPKYVIRDEADRMAVEAIQAVLETSRAGLNNGKVNGGEVFTPHWCAVDMGNMVADKLEDLDATVLEPTCGSGNLLIDVLRRKMATVLRLPAADFKENCKRACKSIYGVDISKDNVVQARERILIIVGNTYRLLFKEDIPMEFTEELEDILSKNIVWGDVIKEQMWNTDTVKSDIDGLATKAGAPLKFMNWAEGKMETLDGQRTLAFLEESEDDEDEVDDF